MPTSGSAIIVGVDHADRSSAALLWAAAEARRRRAVLRIVHARQPSARRRPRSAADVVFAPSSQGHLGRREQEDDLNRVAAILGRVAPDLRVTVEPIEGPPAQVLVDAASNADLLVVGAPEPERSRESPYGSVSGHVVAHAPCEVVVVPEPDPGSIG
jgi:nucleotide-binding universal stress UspA family protein